MTQTTPGFIINDEVHRTFIIRLSWDRTSSQWRILLKPVNGQEERLFSEVETVLLYLEAVMQQEGTRP